MTGEFKQFVQGKPASQAGSHAWTPAEATRGGTAPPFALQPVLTPWPTAARCYWAPEMWLVQLRNWFLNFIQF